MCFRLLQAPDCVCEWGGGGGGHAVELDSLGNIVFKVTRTFQEC